jgi:hypothetical protein
MVNNSEASQAEISTVTVNRKVHRDRGRYIGLTVVETKKQRFAWLRRWWRRLWR